jgi:cystathionine gamma-synthase
MRGKDIVPPIHRSAVFQFESLRALTTAVKQNDYVYSRWTNPTVRKSEELVASLEGTEDSAAFSSGMAAITTLLLSFLKKGDRLLVLRDVYGGTLELARDMLPGWGIEPDWLGVDEILQSMRRAEGHYRLVYIESPTNPLLRILPIRQIADEAQRKGALLVIDNTFGTPIMQKPVSMGADLIVHSASKFLGGHNDLIGGFVAGSRSLVKTIATARRFLGGVMDPHTAFLCWRGIKTLKVRMELQNRNAQRIAEYLESRPEVERVWYPGLKSHPEFLLAADQMSGSGCIVSFELGAGVQGVTRFLKSLKTIRIAPSLGGCDSLVTHPSSTSHMGLSKRERRLAGISDGLLRLSTGIEDVETLIEDLSRGLGCL